MGIVLLVAGLAGLYLAVIDPLMTGNAEIAARFKVALLIPVALVYGVAYTFFTTRATLILGRRNKPTRIGWIAIGGLVCAGLALHIWVGSML